MRRDDVSCHELDGEALLYDGTSGAVHRFNTVSLFVWDACDGRTAAADIARAVTQRYAIDGEEALLHVEGVIVEFSEKGLLQSDDQGCWCENPFSHPAGAGIPYRTTSATEGGRYSRSPGLSRRELLTGGATKLVFAAPVISTFFAAGAYASGPSYSAAFGDGCKQVGYSCGVNPDCCDSSGGRTACNPGSGQCCVQHNQSGCTVDADCCNQNDVCNSGVCE